MSYAVYLLDQNRQRIGQMQNLVPNNKTGNILSVIKRLSNYHSASFRVAKDDPIFKQLGNIVQPWHNGVEITHNNVTIFKGLVMNNPHRTSRYIDVQAYSYLFRLTKKLVKRDVEVNPGDGKDNYRTFNTGTLAAAVQSIITEAQTAVPANDLIKGITFGTINNPNFPSGFVKADTTPLTGAWNFSSDITLQFDYKSLLYVLQSFGIYANCDFELTDSLVLNFKNFLGRDQSSMVFEYSNTGAVFDYDLPLNGQRMTNDLWGIAADLEGNVLHVETPDTVSQTQYGFLEDVVGFLDVKDINPLKARTTEELPIIAYPDNTINIWIDASKSDYGFGMYDIGDIVTIKINDGIIAMNARRRLTGINLTVHNTGREIITVETNPPKDTQS